MLGQQVNQLVGCGNDIGDHPQGYRYRQPHQNAGDEVFFQRLAYAAAVGRVFCHELLNLLYCCPNGALYALGRQETSVFQRCGAHLKKQSREPGGLMPSECFFCTNGHGCSDISFMSGILFLSMQMQSKNRSKIGHLARLFALQARFCPQILRADEM